MRQVQGVRPRGYQAANPTSPGCRLIARANRIAHQGPRSTNDNETPGVDEHGTCAPCKAEGKSRRARTTVSEMHPNRSSTFRPAVNPHPTPCPPLSAGFYLRGLTGGSPTSLSTDWPKSPAGLWSAVTGLHIVRAPARRFLPGAGSGRGVPAGARAAVMFPRPDLWGICRATTSGRPSRNGSRRNRTTPWNRSCVCGQPQQSTTAAVLKADELARS